MTLLDRLMAKVEKTETCWLWHGSVTTGGYGRIKITTTRAEYAHRTAYRLLVGPIPHGLALDHLCRVRNCVNPAHLEPVSQTENNRRAHSFHGAKTHCPRGHVYDADNTLVSKGKRLCRTCRREQQRLRRQRPEVKAYYAERMRYVRRKKRAEIAVVEVDVHGRRVTIEAAV